MKNTILTMILLTFSVVLFADNAEWKRASYFDDLFSELGVDYNTQINLSEIVSDTIIMIPRTVKSAYYNDKFLYVVPDTLWFKKRPKKPIENKHYILLRNFGAYYYGEKKNLEYYDSTPSDKVVGVPFILNSIANDSIILCEPSTGVLLKSSFTFLNDNFFIRSNHLQSLYENNVVGQSFYECANVKRIVANYKHKTICSIDVIIDFRGTVFIKITPSFSPSTFKTKEQFIKDSIAEVRYWEDYNRPRLLHIDVTPNIPYDNVKFAAITNYETERIAFSAKSKGAWVTQLISDGEMIGKDYLSKDSYFFVAGIDTIRGKVYLIGCKQGRVFYVAKNDVLTSWTDHSYLHGTDEFTDVEPNIKTLANSPKEIRDAFFEFTKSWSYDVYLRSLKDLIELQKPMMKSGLFIEECYPTEELYSTGLSLSFRNLTNKTVKYLELTTEGLNAVKDPIKDGVRTVTGVGPISPFGSGSIEFEHVWWTTLVKYHKIKSVTITYMDGTKKTIKQPEIDKCRKSWRFEWAYDDVHLLPELLTGIVNPETQVLDDYPQPLF